MSAVSDMREGMDLDDALRAGDDDAVDDVLDFLCRDQGAWALAQALNVVTSHKRKRGVPEHELTGWHYRRAAALESAAAAEGITPGDAAAHALEAVTLARDVLNDGESADRALALALRLSADDDAALKRTVGSAGGPAPAIALLEKFAKKAKGDDALQSRLRRTLSRLYEIVLLDKERAFFEALKAARKQPEGITIDDAFRLALEAKRLDEAAAFFQSLGDEPALPARARASALNKLGAVHDAKGDQLAAFAAYVSSLSHFETKAARKKAERIREELGLKNELPTPRANAPTPGTGATTAATTTAVTSDHSEAFPKTAAQPEDLVEQNLAKAMNPDIATLLGLPPAGFAGLSMPPPPPASDEDVFASDVNGEVNGEVHGEVNGEVKGEVKGEGDGGPLQGAGDVFSAAADQFDKPVFTDEVRIRPESSAHEAEIVSEDIVDPILRSHAEKEDSRRSQQAPANAPPGDEAGDFWAGSPALPGGDEPSAFRPRGDPTAETHDTVVTATLLPEAAFTDSSSLMGASSTAPQAAMPPPTAKTKTNAKAQEKPDALLSHAGAPRGAPALLPVVKPALTRAPPVLERVTPTPATAPVQSSELRERKKAKRERKKKKMQRGHSTAVDETTRPSSATGFTLNSETSELGVFATSPIPAALDDAGARLLRGDPLPARAFSALTVAGGNTVAVFDSEPPEAQGARLVAAGTEAEHNDGGGPGSPRPPAMPLREQLLAKSQSLINDGNVEECLSCATELQTMVAGDARILRLAGRALWLAAPTGHLPEVGLQLVLKDAERHGERAATIIRDVQLALPPVARTAYGALWLAGARAAGHDVDRVHAVLEDVADSDGPDGPLFTFLDALLQQHNDVDRRDQLYLRAARLAPNDDSRRVRLLRARIALLQDARRDGPVVQAWAQLVLENDVDGGIRTQARQAHERSTTPDERAKFLARLIRLPALQGKAPADKTELVGILRELLELRVAVDDSVGAESTARELLSRIPGDARATTVLADLLADDPRRTGEVVAALRACVDTARAANDNDGARQTLERLARALASAGRNDEATAALVEAVKLAPADQPLVERVLENLQASDRIAEAVDLLEDLGNRAVARDAAMLLLRGAALARDRLNRRDRARELIEKAALLQPKDLRVLDAQAELLLELGDAPAALAALEKISAEEKDSGARARVHLRIGRLLEEHLQRTDDALKRYRAAVDVDRSLKDAWDALHQLGRQKGLSDVVVDALTGLASLHSGRDKATVLVKLGRVHAQERNDQTAAAAAFEGALVANASDIDALSALLLVRALALQGERDIDAALAAPDPELVDEFYQPLLAAEAQGAALPFGFRRMLALAVTQDGDHNGARIRFEALLEERGDDLPTLLAFARHLTAAARLPAPAKDAAIADARRREVLEAVLLHHAYALKPAMHVNVWGEICSLRLQHGDVQGAKKAAKKAMALVAASERPANLEESLSDRAVRALVLCLEEGLNSAAGLEVADVDLLEQALKIDLQRAVALSEKSKLKEKQARIALHRKDSGRARQLLEEALKHDPDASSAREMLFDIELSGEDPRQAFDQSRALVATERDPHKKAALHLRLFRLQKKLRMPDDVAAVEIKAAIELDPKNIAVLDAAEQFFADKKDGRGLDALYTTRLKSLDRNDVSARLLLLERLAQLRRYDLRDLRAAIDACEAQSALNPDAIKPREDAARLHVELGQWKEALHAWRAVLDRDILLKEAWRGLFWVYARSHQADDAFAVASTMAALEVADDDMVRAVRAVRPPFPRWPLAAVDVTSTKKKLAHPLERTAVRAVLDIVAPRLLPRLGRPLQDFGVRRRDALVESKLPASVAVAVRTGAALAGFSPLSGSLPLYQAEIGAVDGTNPPFAALPAREPGLIITSEVLRGGMTPERAFALGRAMAWLSPWALLAASLDAAEIRRLLEGCVAAFLSPRDVEKPSPAIEQYGAELQKELLAGFSTTEKDTFVAALAPPLRDWVVGRDRLPLSDWKAGVGYTGDRLGFLLSGDLPAAVKVVRAAGGSTTGVGVAIRELVLFTVSPQYLQLRKELSLALPEQALAPIIDLG